MSDDAPRKPRRANPIAYEWVIFVLLCLGVGAVFVALRVAKDGPQVLTVAPHAR